MHQKTARWVLGIVGFSLLLIEATASVAHATEYRRRGVVRGRQITHASWYGNEFRGRPTASGARFDPRRMTAAHRTLRLGTRVRVTELVSGRSVVVEINDRGPYVKGRGIDLSQAAARSLGMVNRGVARVAIEVVPDRRAEPIVVASAANELASWLPKAILR